MFVHKIHGQNTVCVFCLWPNSCSQRFLANNCNAYYYDLHPLCFKLCFTAALFITPLTPRISGSGSGPGDLTGDPSSRVQNVDQGAQVLLECIKPPEADRIEWSRENNKPLPEQHYFEGNLLVIPRITPDDGGIYYCTAIYTSGDSEPTSALVNVRNGEAMITHSIYSQTNPDTSKNDEKCFLSSP